MINELKRRYFNMEIFIWIIAGIIAELLCMSYIVYVITFLGHSQGEFCALDIFDVMSDHYLFPFLMLISALCNQRMMKCDRDPMIILKYNSKQGIYFWQLVCTIVYSFVMSVIYIVVAIAYGCVRFKVFYNWNEVDSYFANYTLSSSVTDIPAEYVILLYVIVMALLMLATCMLGIIAEIIFNSDMISGAVIIIFAVMDVFKSLTYSKLVFYETTWLHENRCMKKTSICLAIAVILIIAGYFLQRRREYYEYKKEDE